MKNFRAGCSNRGLNFDTGDSRKTRFCYPRFLISAVLFQYHEEHVALGGVVVSVLATGPKVAGSNLAEDDGF
jgi:hypothetical protein